ncbi:hypothetical protein [Rhizobium leguminosarum]|uniref:Integral membrane protein n=1 Tax=Rhizobium leguminosarum TaxID=384 RepID=A0A7K3VMJ3_RHILE|nr:hypothetical protein [Rhizobium leguminosarum]NEK18400.1 hypothetical protein [Rhizobium leguminosarum]NEK37393.1 hypothetical protein [Rhizobium leguminosarum]
MDRLASLCIAAALGFGAFVGASSADAMTMKDCGVKYKAAQATNSLNGDVTLFDQRPKSRLSVNSGNSSGHGFPLRHGADPMNLGG